MLEEAHGLALREALVLDDVIEQLAALRVLHNEVNIGLGLDDLLRRWAYLVQLDDVGMSKDLEDADLACDSFDVSLLDDLLLLQGLDCHLLRGMDMHAHPHLAESALADALA